MTTEMDRTSTPVRVRISRVLALLTALAALALLAAPAASAKVPDSFFGINATLPTDEDYSRMGKAGFGAYRFDVNWAGVQRTRKGAFDWNGPDAAVRQAAINGMQPTPLLIGTPRFVKRDADGLYPPTESRANGESWELFVFAAASRYGPGGAFWQENPGLPELPIRKWLIWNEQNAQAFWKPKPSPRDYAALVQIADRGITAADPKAKIVLGGMYGYPSNDQSLTAFKFLRKFYAVKGIEDHFDAIALHPYGAGVGTVKTQIKEARDVARRAGDRNVGILVGELGWASSGPDRSVEVVGSKGQATRLRKGLDLLVAKRRAWNIQGAFVYVWRDFAPELTACLWCPTAGLVGMNGSNKPALSAVRGVIRSSR